MNEAVKLRGGLGPGAWFDWLFLALACEELGRVDDARQALAKAEGEDQPPWSRPSPTWDARLERTLLRREAAAPIVYDPIFPSDPFAH